MVCRRFEERSEGRRTVGIKPRGRNKVRILANLGVNGCVEPPPGTVARPIRDLRRVTYSALFLKGEEASPGVRRLLETVQANVLGAPIWWL